MGSIWQIKEDRFPSALAVGRRFFSISLAPENQKNPDAFSIIYCIIEYMKLLLDEIMEQRNLTERQVSILTGLSRSSVHEIRKGSMPRVDTLEQLAKGLKIKISDLIESDYL